MKYKNKEKRTGIMAGDKIRLIKGNRLLLQVLRSKSKGDLYEPLVFEGSMNDDKWIINFNKSTEVIMFICLITGLQAKLIKNDTDSDWYILRKGDSIFAD